MAERFDYILNIGADADAITKEIEAKIKEAKASVNNQVLTISNVKIDDNGVFSSFIKQLQSLAKSNIIKLDIDFTDFNKYQDKIDNIQKSLNLLDKTEIKNLVSSDLNKGIKVVGEDIKKLKKESDELFDKLSGKTKKAYGSTGFTNFYKENKPYLDKFKSDVETVNNILGQKKLTGLSTEELSEVYRLLIEIQKINAQLTSKNKVLSDGTKLFDLSTDGLEYTKLIPEVEKQMETIRRKLITSLSDLQNNQSSTIFSPIIDALKKVEQTANKVSNGNKDVELVNTENVKSTSKEIDALNEKLEKLESRKNNIAISILSNDGDEDAVMRLKEEKLEIEKQISSINKTIQAYQNLNLDGAVGSSILSIKELNENLEEESEKLKQVQSEFKKYGAAFSNLSEEDAINKLKELNAQFDKLKAEGKNKPFNVEFLSLRKEIGSLYKYIESKGYDSSSMGSFINVAKAFSQNVKIDEEAVNKLKNQEKWHQHIIDRIKEEIRLKEQSSSVKSNFDDSDQTTEISKRTKELEQNLSNKSYINSEEVEKITSLLNELNTKSKIKIDVDIQEAIANTDIIQEKINKIPEKKDIEIRIHENDIDDALSRINQTPLLSNNSASNIVKENQDIIESNQEVIASEEKKDSALNKAYISSASPNVDNFQKEKEIVDTTIDAEKTKLKELTSSLSDVVEAVDKKTDAFIIEGQIVDEVINGEISKLQELSSTLNDISNKVKAVSDLEIKVTQEQADQKEKRPAKKPAEKVTNPSKEGYIPKDTYIQDIGQAWDSAIAEDEELKVKKVADAYDELTGKLKDYFSLLDKKIKGTLSDGKNGADNVNNFKDLSTEINEAIVGQGKYANAVDAAADAQDSFNKKLKELKEFNANNIVDSLQGKLEKWESPDGKISSYSKHYDEVANKIYELQSRLPIDVANEEEIKRLKDDIADIEKSIKNLNGEELRGAKISNVDNLISGISRYSNLNTAAPKELKSELQLLLKRVQEARDNIDSLNKIEFDKLKSEFSNIKSRIEQTGKTGVSMADKIGNKFKDVFSYFATYVSIYDFIQTIREAYQYVVDIDTQMIELEKVSDMTGARLEESFEHATEAAKDLGSTVSDIISATADWSRLGYNADDAEQLAEVATIYKNVGDGIDIDTANNSLISTLQGFKMDANEAMKIVDSFNEVANRMPIDSAGIGEALQRSAASFNAANTDLNESIALITATNAVVQDPTRVGNMWKTVSMRIRGATAELQEAGLETDGMVESTSQLRELIKGMTGFDIMVDDSTYKDIKEIVVGIGKEWDKLSDIDQAALLEKLAGKTQGNALAAALSNWEMIEEAYAIAEESEGSARKEQEKWEQGLEARTNKLKASLEILSTTVLDSDFLGGAIDAGRGFIDVLTEIIDTLGLIPTLLTSGGGIFAAMKSFKGEGKWGFKNVLISFNMPSVV